MNYEYAHVSLSQERRQSQGQYIFSDNGHVYMEANFRMEKVFFNTFLYTVCIKAKELLT